MTTDSEDADYEDDMMEWANRMVSEDESSGIDALIDPNAWLSFIDQKIDFRTGTRASAIQLRAMAKARPNLLRAKLRGLFPGGGR